MVSFRRIHLRQECAEQHRKCLLLHIFSGKGHALQEYKSLSYRAGSELATVMYLAGNGVQPPEPPGLGNLARGASDDRERRLPGYW
jgi:hypothetical protein